jgi:hypothetical protein
MRAPALALSLLGTEIKALTYRHGSLSSKWANPEPWDDPENLAGIIKLSLSKAEPDGREVALVLAHPRLIDQVVELPPAKGWTLERLIERQAQNSKAFPGVPVWSWQPALPTKKTNAVLLHLLPRSTLDELSQGCQGLHLHLVRVLPTSAVLIGQLKALPLEKDEVALLAAETGRSTTIVVGRKDGRVALGRVLANSWTTAPDRVWVDLTRSIGFVEQQCGITVNSAWLFGPGAEAQIPAVQAVLKLPVRLSPVPYSPFYWAEQAAELTDKNDGNLVSLQDREAPRRRRVMALTICILTLLVLLALGALGGVEIMRQMDLKSLREINNLTSKLQDRKQEWQRKRAELERKRVLIEALNQPRSAPVPAWFFGYLGEAVPEDLVVSDLYLVRTNQCWAVRISGTAQPVPRAGSPPLVGAGSRAFATFTNRLVNGPFRLQITNGAYGRQFSPTSPTNTLAKGSVRSRAPSLPTLNPFLIEGVIQ